MKRPWQITLYRTATRLAQPAASLILRHRLKKGKEDPARIGERQARPGLKRPDGRLVWIHGASVGETMSMTPVVERLMERGYQVLVTSGTVASARIMAERLPSAAMHQFIPLDTPGFMRRFFRYWRTHVGLVAESEIWPNMILEAAKADLPLMLLNGRMSDRSFERWSKQRPAANALLSRFDVILAQSRLDGERYLSLGAPRVVLGGNLKYDVTPPPVDHVQLALLQGMTAGRPVWIAASTHPGEDEIVIDAHRRLAERQPRLLTILIPRHTQRGPEIEALARAAGLPTARRSDGLPPDRAVDLYVADTLGELGLFYRLAPIAFIGGTLAPRGGHNPIEPAKLGVAIVHGPHVENNADIYASLDDSGGAVAIADAEGLARVVLRWLEEAREARETGRRAMTAVADLAGAGDRVMQALDPLLARAALKAGRA